MVRDDVAPRARDDLSKAVMIRVNEHFVTFDRLLPAFHIIVQLYTNR